MYNICVEKAVKGIPDTESRSANLWKDEEI